MKYKKKGQLDSSSCPGTGAVSVLPAQSHGNPGEEASRALSIEMNLKKNKKTYTLTAVLQYGLIG